MASFKDVEEAIFKAQHTPTQGLLKKRIAKKKSTQEAFAEYLADTL